MINIIFRESQLEVIEKEIVSFGTVETGGVLMGCITDKGITVEAISGPGPKAIHEDIYFRADPDYIDMFIDMSYANSQGEWEYLGEWHTHPQIIPEPSVKDLISLEEIAESSDNFAILLIVGAIDYTSEKFLRQSTAIIKFRQEGKFHNLRSIINL